MTFPLQAPNIRHTSSNEISDIIRPKFPKNSWTRFNPEYRSKTPSIPPYQNANTINEIFHLQHFPTIYKQVTIMSIPKAGKPVNLTSVQLASYRH